MNAPRKKRNARTAPPSRRRLFWGVGLVVVALLAVLAVTQPRQLPSVIADHVAVRTAYAWRDATYTKIHHFIYPLAALRTDDRAPAQRDGVGYKEQDRDALDQLLKSKEEPQP